MQARDQQVAVERNREREEMAAERERERAEMAAERERERAETAARDAHNKQLLNNACAQLASFSASTICRSHVSIY